MRPSSFSWTRASSWPNDRILRLMDMAPNPLWWLAPLSWVALIAGILLVTMPSLRRWRAVGWWMLLATAVFFGAALVWTWLF